MRILAIMLAALTLSLASHAADPGTGENFKGPIGLQLYSLRAQFMAEGVPATLDRVKAYGFKYVELAGTYGQPPEKFKAMLDERGLVPVSGHFGYDRYKKEPEAVAKEAKALGLKYAGCAWISHKAPFDEAATKDAIAVFNKAGEILAKEGIKLFYHVHGYEFHPHGDGTLFDLFVKETNKDYVSLQMDVLWVVFPGQDPVKLLEKYPGRWVSMHLKDLRKGIPLGSLSGKTDVKNDVTLGTGQMEWPKILPAAQKAGLQYYFIEDESPDVTTQIPQTMKYLEQVKF
jgi:sugar phosphate isomerase/epimerase